MLAPMTTTTADSHCHACGGDAGFGVDFDGASGPCQCDDGPQVRIPERDALFFYLLPAASPAEQAAIGDLCREAEIRHGTDPGQARTGDTVVPVHQVRHLVSRLAAWGMLPWPTTVGADRKIGSIWQIYVARPVGLDSEGSALAPAEWRVWTVRSEGDLRGEPHLAAGLSGTSAEIPPRFAAFMEDK